MNLGVGYSGILSGDGLEHLDASSMSKCSKPAPVPCSFIDDSLLDLIHQDDYNLLSAALKKNPSLAIARNDKGQTLLHIAAARNRHRCVEVLLQLNADEFAAEKESGWTPLHAALYRGSLLAAKSLLQHKTGSTAILDSEGNAPFDLVLPVSARPDHNVVRTRHVLISFGNSSNLQLGVVSDSLSANRPKSLDALLQEDIAHFDVCEIGGAAVSASGDAFSWGVNKNGRLGVGDDASRIRPERVPLPLSSDKRCIAVVVSLTHSVFLLSNGEVYTCGKGYLGHDPAMKGQQQSSIVRRVEKGLKRVNVVNISCSKFRTCMVTETGEALLLGYHMADEGIDYVPTKIEGLNNVCVVSMLTTNGHWIAQSIDGDLYEQTRRERRFFRVPISRISKKDTNRPAVTRFSTCKSHSVAVTSDGTLWAWPSRAVKGGAPESSSRPIPPRQVKAIRNFVITKASTSVDHTSAVTANGDLIEWGHEAPRAPAPGQRFPSDWLPVRGEKATRLLHPRQLVQVKCAPGCTLVSQEFRLFNHEIADHEVARSDSSSHQIPSLLRMCEKTLCATIDERRAVAAFRFGFNFHFQFLLDHCSYFIIRNSPALLFNALRELDFTELEYLQDKYQECLPASILQYARNDKPPVYCPIEDALELEWFVPHTVRHLRAKIRSSAKKLSQIQILCDRLANGDSLNPEQLRKVKQKERLRLFLQQCQGELASKLEPDPVIEFVRPPETDLSEPREIVTIVRAKSRHNEDIWREDFDPVRLDSLFLPSSPSPSRSKQTRLEPKSVSATLGLNLSQEQTRPIPSVTSASENTFPAQVPEHTELPVVKSTLSYALASSLKSGNRPAPTEPPSAPTLSSSTPFNPSTHSVSFASQTDSENTATRKSNSYQPPPKNSSASVSLADFWSNDRSAPINIKSRSKTHSAKVKQQEASPVATGSPWNMAGRLRAKPLAEIQHKDAAMSKWTPSKNVKQAQSPWASHSPPVSSFANIIQEEMAMKLMFPGSPKNQPRSCWGPQSVPTKPNSIESIQSLQFIQEEIDREAKEQAQAIQTFNQNQKRNRYRRKPSDSSQECRRDVAASENRRQGSISRASTRSQ